VFFSDFVDLIVFFWTNSTGHNLFGRETLQPGMHYFWLQEIRPGNKAKLDSRDKSEVKNKNSVSGC
jgi:hypothetical protein